VGADADNAALIVASFELGVVQLIRKAIRTADEESGQCGSACGCSNASQTILPRQVVTPTVRYEPRQVIHPTDTYEPRKVIHPTPRIENEPVYVCPKPQSPDPSPTVLPPPWRMPITNIPIPPRPIVKQITHKVDVHNKGSLIDVFL
jgi:hypothetical protein